MNKFPRTELITLFESDKQQFLLKANALLDHHLCGKMTMDSRAFSQHELKVLLPGEMLQYFKDRSDIHICSCAQPVEKPAQHQPTVIEDNIPECQLDEINIKKIESGGWDDICDDDIFDEDDFEEDNNITIEQFLEQMNDIFTVDEVITKFDEMSENIKFTFSELNDVLDSEYDFNDDIYEKRTF